MKKKLIGYVLALALAFGAIPVIPAATGFGLAVTASAETTKDGFVIKTSAGGNKFVSGYTGKGGDITIPDGVDYIGDKAFYNNDKITSVTIPESVWYCIGKNAFGWCSNLKSVNIEGDLAFIGKNAFEYCLSLEEITIEGDLSLVNEKTGAESGGIYGYAFVGCKSLKKVKFTKKDAVIGYIGDYAFYNCVNLTSINLPSNTKSIYSAFVNCRKLEKVTVPKNTKMSTNYKCFGYVYGKENSAAKTDTWGVADGSISRKITLWTYDKDLGRTRSEYTVKPKAITLKVTKGSPAEKWAKENGIKYEY